MSADESGCLIGRTHHFPVRVYFADTDAAGLVYHATYFVFAERARTEMMRLAGFDHGDLHKRLGMLLGVRSCQAEYLRPARLDDLLEIRTTIEELAGASLRLRQEVWRGEDEIARVAIRLACIGADGRPSRIPDQVRETIQDYLTAEAI
jgi:acyl-CoA thioester hydrolase